MARMTANAADRTGSQVSFAKIGRTSIASSRHGESPVQTPASAAKRRPWPHMRLPPHRAPWHAPVRWPRQAIRDAEASVACCHETELGVLNVPQCLVHPLGVLAG